VVGVVHRQIELAQVNEGGGRSRFGGTVERDPQRGQTS
jgi:hypothetical protein